MLCLAKERGWPAPYISQPMYNLLARGIEQEYLPMCKEFGVSTVVYNPLAGGLLTGKHKQEKITPGTRFDNNKLYQDRYWHDQYFQSVEQLRKIAQSAGRSLVSLALNWLLHHTASDCIILGASRLEQLNENLATLDDGPLPDRRAEGLRRGLAQSARAAAGVQPLGVRCGMLGFALGDWCAQPLPDAPDGVVVEQPFVADQRQILRLRLGDEHAIKRIAMLARQCACALRVSQRNRQRAKAELLDNRRNISRYRVSIRQLSQAMLSRNLPGRRRRHEHLVIER